MVSSNLYNIITKYYPLGIDELDSRYSEYHGINELLHISNVMFNSENYEMRWKGFINSFVDEINGIHEAVDESSLSEWCYTGSFLIRKRAIDNIIHTKELVINVSFITSVYTVFGRDRVQCVEDGDVIEFDPFLTVSPYGYYENSFSSSRDKIERDYPGYKFISFDLLSEKIKSVYVPGSINGQDSSLYQTLFKLHDITGFPYQGDPYYE